MTAGSVLKTAGKLLLWSLLLGVLLSLLGYTPAELLASLDETLGLLFTRAITLVASAVPYVLLGALVVVPIWLLGLLWQRFRR